MQGCVSQVWLSTHVDRSGNVPRLSFVGDSDAHIVRGLIAILFSLYSGKTADEIVRIDAGERLGLLHLNEHLTPQRSNGLMAMVKRIRTDAELALRRSARCIRPIERLITTLPRSAHLNATHRALADSPRFPNGVILAAPASASRSPISP